MLLLYLIIRVPFVFNVVQVCMCVYVFRFNLDLDSAIKLR